MKQNKLRQVLSTFEKTNRPLSLTQIAHDLDMPVMRLEGMIQYWIRKGKIRENGSYSECGSCNDNENCPFVMEMPQSYELVTSNSGIPLPIMSSPACGRNPGGE